MVPLILSTFGIIFLAELPDKTALASLVLATRYPARHVVLGAWLAFLVQSVVAVAAGSLFQLLPAQIVRLTAGLSFLAFALFALRRKVEDDLALESHQANRRGKGHWAPWMTSFLVVFAAEWGDLTQLATAALVARTGQPLAVGIGAVAALWSVTVIAVFAGAQVGRLVAHRILNRVSAAVFIAAGLSLIGSSFVDS